MFFCICFTAGSEVEHWDETSTKLIIPHTCVLNITFITENTYKFFVGNPTVRDSFHDLGVDGRMTPNLKCPQSETFWCLRVALTTNGHW